MKLANEKKSLKITGNHITFKITTKGILKLDVQWEYSQHVCIKAQT